jgi:hypothetical protein
MRTAPWIAIALSLTLGGPARANPNESHVKLKAGPGRDKVLARCTICHSADYIPMNSVFLDRKGWEAEVDKMVHAMGAPVQPDEVPVIVDYLTRNYGRAD